MSGLEATIQTVVQALALGIEALGALVIGSGVVATAYHWARARFTPGRRVERTRQLRLELSRYLALALELQLASDILSTIVAPSWQDLGQLAAVAAIRTFLNVFLAREMRELHDAEPAPT